MQQHTSEPAVSRQRTETRFELPVELWSVVKDRYLGLNHARYLRVLLDMTGPSYNTIDEHIFK